MKRSKYDDWYQSKYRFGSRRRIIDSLKGRGLTLKELVQETGLSKPSLYKNLDYLIGQGLVRKVAMKGEKEFQGDKRALRRKAWDEYRLTKKGVKELSYMHFPGVAVLSQGFPVMEPTSNYMQLVGMMVHYCIFKEIETGEPWTMGLETMIKGMKREASDNRKLIVDFKKNFKPFVTFCDNVSDAMAYFDEGNKLAGLSKKEMRVPEKIRRDLDSQINSYKGDHV